jgi:hypothetical protein
VVPMNSSNRELPRSLIGTVTDILINAGLEVAWDRTRFGLRLRVTKRDLQHRKLLGLSKEYSEDELHHRIHVSGELLAEQILKQFALAETNLTAPQAPES